MYCNNCGAKNVDGAKFCINCGEPLVQPASSAPSAWQDVQGDDSQKGPLGAEAAKRVSPQHDSEPKHNRGSEDGGGGKKPHSKRHGIIGATVAMAVFIGVGIGFSGGSIPEPTPAPEPDPTVSETVESPEQYGTSPANIANGGYIAYADGMVYYIGNPKSKTSGSSYARTGICVLEDGVSQRKVLYKAGKQKGTYTDSKGKTKQIKRQRKLSCLHVVGDSLVFCVEYQTTDKDSLYDIVQTDLHGNGREKLVTECDISSVPTSLSRLGSYLWVDEGNLYYVNSDGIWSKSLEGGEQTHVVDLVSGEAYSIDDGTAYYTSDSGWSVTAKTISTGNETTVFESDWIEGIEDQGSSLMNWKAPKVSMIIPEGDRIYYGIAEGTVVSTELDGCISVNREGGDGRYEFAGIYDSDNNSSALTLTIGDGKPYVVYGGSFGGGGLAVIRMDRVESSDASTADSSDATVLYQTDGTGQDNDGVIGDWLGLANGRLFFESGGATGIRTISFDGTQSEQELYDRGTPWSVNLDGTDLRRGSE